MLELKPCPFCGGDKVDIHVSGMSGVALYYSVCCNECGSSGGLAEAKDEAIGLWNRREL
jgi:Lar family restriction alleviation protein